VDVCGFGLRAADVDWLPGVGQQWVGFKRLVMLEPHRTMGGKTSVGRRYCISSRAIKAHDMAQLIRVHSGVESACIGCWMCREARMAFYDKGLDSYRNQGLARAIGILWGG